MRHVLIAGQQPQAIGDFRAHDGYAVVIQISKGQIASGVRIDTDPTVLMSGGGITLDPALAAGTSGSIIILPEFGDRLYAVVDSGSTNISLDVMRYKKGGHFDTRKQASQGSFEQHPDLTRAGKFTAK